MFPRDINFSHMIFFLSIEVIIWFLSCFSVKKNYIEQFANVNSNAHSWNKSNMLRVLMYG